MKDNLKSIVCGILAAASFFFANAQSAKEGFTLRVKLDNNALHDTMIMDLTEQWVLKETEEIRAICDSNGVFSFEVKNGKDDGYWSLRLLRNEDGKNEKQFNISPKFYWEKGDDIDLHLRFDPKATYQNSLYNFNGTGAEKYRLTAYLFYTDSVAVKYDNKNVPGHFDSSYTFRAIEDPFMAFRMKEIEAKKKFLSPKAYDILRADANYPSYPFFFADIGKLIQNLGTSDSAKIFKKNYLRSTATILPARNDEGVKNSYSAIKRIQQKIFKDIQIYYYPTKNELSFYYDYVKPRTSGEIRERLLIDYFNNYNQPKNIDSLLVDARTFFKTKKGLEELDRLSRPIHNSIGRGYTFIDHNKKIVQLDSLKGKVILVDIYFAGCSPCITLYNNVISKIKKKYEGNKDFVIVALSVDKNFDTWNQSLQKGLYTSFSPNTINVNTGSSGRSHPFVVDNKILTNPSLLIIDKSGKTRFSNNQILFEYESLDKTIANLLQ